MTTELHDEHVKEWERHQVAREWESLRAESIADLRLMAKVALAVVRDLLTPFGLQEIGEAQAIRAVHETGTEEERRRVDSAINKYTRVMVAIENASPRLVA